MTNNLANTSENTPDGQNEKSGKGSFKSTSHDDIQLKNKSTPGPNTDKDNHHRWQWTSTELKSAIDDWEVLSKNSTGPSPDEQMLQDMQKLIVDLKQKMDEFSKI